LTHDDTNTTTRPKYTTRKKLNITINPLLLA
jgi:hypothetical protein